MIRIDHAHLDGEFVARTRRRAPPRRRSRTRISDDFTQGRFKADFRARYDVYNAAEYRFYWGSTPPVEGDSPKETNSTLDAYVTTATFGNGVHFVSVSFFNGVLDSGFSPLGPNGETYLRLDVSGGVEIGSPPSGPVHWTLRQINSTTALVEALYREADSSVRATEWAIGIDQTGSDPPADAPDETVSIGTGPLVILRHEITSTAGAAADLKVRLQTRRGTIYSENSVVKTIDRPLSAPSSILQVKAWPGRLPEGT